MAVKARLHQYPGKLSLSGHINTRLPQVTDGLIVTYPFDGCVEGITNNNDIDPSTWVIGSTGSQPGFVADGGDLENHIVGNILDPWGNPDKAVWEAWNNDVDSNADGGWEGDAFNIDSTKTYRFSVWVNREVVGSSGTVYFGCHGFNSVGGNIGVLSLADVVNTNPYFRSRSQTGWGDGSGLMLENEWYLWVGHIHYYGYTGSTHADSGIWDREGNFIYSTIDFKWQELNAQTKHRARFFYSTDPSVIVQYIYPRAEVLDEYAPTLQDLLDGRHDVVHLSDEGTSYYSVDDCGCALDYPSENYLPQFKCNSYCTPGSYQPGWDNDMHPLAIDDANWSGYGSGVADAGLIYHAQNIHDPEFPQGDHSILFFRNEPGPNQIQPTWQGSSYIINNPASDDWAIGDDLSFSFDLKSDVVGGYIVIGIYHRLISSGLYGFAGSAGNFYVTKRKNDWERKTYTWTIDSDVDLTGMFKMYIYGHYPSFNCKTWVKDIQVEKLDHSTSYIGDLATRLTTGIMYLPKPKEYSLVEGSVHLRMIVPDAWYSDITYNDLFDCYLSGTGANRHLLIRKDTASTTADRIYIRNGTGWSSISTLSTRYTPGDVVDFFWTWKNGANCKIYVDDEIVINASYTTGDREFDYFKFKHGTVIKCFSIWDRQLSDDEVFKVMGNAASVKSTGELVAPIVNSKLIENADNAWYFPLNENGKDIMETISPFSDTPSCYFGEDGYLAGHYFYNYSDPTDYTFSSIYSVKDLTNFPKLHPESIIIGKELLEDGNAIFTMGETVVGTDFDNKFSASIMIWVDIIDQTEGLYFYPLVYTTTEPIGITQTPMSYNGIIEAKDMPQRTWIEVTGDNYPGYADFIGATIRFYANKNQTKIYATCPSLTEPVMSRHYVNGGCSANSLKYNLYNEGMDWSGDWTICYWKKPVGTHVVDDLTGYNLESLGGPDASYFWWGKHNGSDYVRTSVGTLSNGTFDPDDYFGLWEFVSLTKSGTIQTQRTWLQDGVERFRDMTNANAADDQYVTSSGYDFQLGGWYDNNTSNSYYKDLLVCTYALSDADLNNIRKKKMRITKDNFLMIQDGLLTGDNTL